MDVLPEIITNSWLKHGAGWGIGSVGNIFLVSFTNYRQLIGNPQSNWYL